MAFHSVLGPLLFICIRNVAVVLTCLDIGEFDLLCWVEPRVERRVVVDFDPLDEWVIV